MTAPTEPGSAPVAAGESAPTRSARLCQDCSAVLSAVNKNGYCRSCNARRLMAKANGNRWGGESVAPVPKSAEVEAPEPEPLIVSSVDRLNRSSTERPFRPSTEETQPEPDPETTGEQVPPEEESAILRRAVVAPANGYLAGIAIADRLSIRDQRTLNAAITDGLKVYRVHRFEIHQSCDTGRFYAAPLRAVLRPGAQRVCRIGRNNGQVVPEFVPGFKLIEAKPVSPEVAA